jgi:hypothetical protein
MLILIALPSFISPKPLPGGFHRQALALELVRNPDDIEQITRVYPPPEVNRDLMLDTSVFIPLYVLLFLSISLWLAGSHVPRPLLLAGVIAACVLLAGAFDVAENLRQWAILERADQAGADRVRHAALVKWFLLFFMTAVLSLPFLRRRSWVRTVGILYLLTAAVGITGVLDASRHPLIEWGFTILGLALLPTGEAAREFESRAS